MFLAYSKDVFHISLFSNAVEHRGKNPRFSALADRFRTGVDEFAILAEDDWPALIQINSARVDVLVDLNSFNRGTILIREIRLPRG